MTSLNIVIFCWLTVITFSFTKKMLEQRKLTHRKFKVLYTITFFWAGSIPIAIAATLTFLLFIVFYK